MRRQSERRTDSATRLRFHLFPPVLAGLAFMAASCGTTRVESWMNPAYSDRPPGKVVVVGVAQNDDVRRQYEDHFVERLAAVGVEGVASCAVIPQTAHISKEDIDNAVSEFGADSVIVTRVTREVDRAQVMQGTSMPAAYNDYHDYYESAYEYVHTPGYAQNYIEFLLETNLYDAETGDLVWSGRKMITDQHSTGQNIKSVISATIGDLQKNGLL